MWWFKSTLKEHDIITKWSICTIQNINLVSQKFTVFWQATAQPGLTLKVRCICSFWPFSTDSWNSSSHSQICICLMKHLWSTDWNPEAELQVKGSVKSWIKGQCHSQARRRRQEGMSATFIIPYQLAYNISWRLHWCTREQSLSTCQVIFSENFLWWVCTHWNFCS